MKYSFGKLFRNNMEKTVHKAAQERKAKSISASASLKTLFVAALAMVFSIQACMKNTLEEYGSTNGSNDISFICKESNSNGNDNDKETKTAPTTSLTQPIGLFAYKHNMPQLNSSATQIAHNHQIKPIGGGYWKGSNNLIWPDESFVTFFAYYPYYEAEPNISFNPTLPIITYSIPTDISKQIDLLSAKSIPYFIYNKTKPIVSLLFNHALTAIQFKTGANLPAGVTIKSISFKNIYFKGKHSLGTKGENAHAWTVDQTQKRDFTLTLNYSSDGTAGKDITTPDNTFFLLPQTLPSEAAVEVTMMINGQLKTLKKAINGKTWKQGEKIVYNLSSSKITQETFTLEAVATGTANYDGSGNITYNIKSTKTDGFGQSSFVPWTMEFSTDNGAHWTTNKPDFINLTTQENNGDLTAKSYTATFAPQEKTIGGTSADILKAREILNDVDLSHRDIHGNTHSNGQTTANCYVIHNPGTYKFPAIYGNAMKNGADNKSAYTSTKSGSNILSPFLGAHGPITKPQIENIVNACLIWQDTQNLISNISFDSANQYVKFEVNKATIHNGNAIIAVRDASNTILWSWHIWVTEEDLTPVEVTNYQGIKYNFMPINLGWCALDDVSYKEREVKVRIKQVESNKTKEITLKQAKYILSEYNKRDGNCTYYQWGRKDPMLPGNGISNTDKTYFTTDTQYAFQHIGLNTNDIKEYIRNPHKFNIKQEMDGKYYNLWSTNNDRIDANDDVVIKSVYDPSPVGYSLPAPNAFTGFTTTGKNANAADQFNVNGTWDNGWWFYGNANRTGDTVFFPASGCRTCITGSFSYGSTFGFYWVAGPRGGNDGRYLSFVSGIVSPLDYTYLSYGFTVRPAKEK